MTDHIEMPSPQTSADRERDRLKTAWPVEFADGEKQGLERFTNYPRGMLTEWADDRRNAWWAGFNSSYTARKKGLRATPRG